MGKFSRTKGRRGEQELVLYLAKRGYKAERNLRQYQVSEQYDVWAKREEEFHTFEVKLRRDAFKPIYDLYYALREQEHGLFLFSHSEDNQCVAMSTDFQSLLRRDSWFFPILTTPQNKKVDKILDKILKLKELKLSADFLVLRDNRKPFLFIRYW